MPIELMIDFETTIGHNIPENLKIYAQEQERRNNPRLTSVIRVMNKMIRDIAANNIPPEDRAIFNTTTTVQCNAAKYAIARKQPAFDFIAQLGRHRWSSVAIHIAKQVHGIAVSNFDTDRLVSGTSGTHRAVHVLEDAFPIVGEIRQFLLGKVACQREILGDDGRKLVQRLTNLAVKRHARHMSRFGSSQRKATPDCVLSRTHRGVHVRQDALPIVGEIRQFLPGKVACQREIL